MFSCEHCKIFKSTYSEVHLRMTAFEFLKSRLKIYILAENFILNFWIYKIFSYLLSFADFGSTKFVFANVFCRILFPTFLATFPMLRFPVA